MAADLRAFFGAHLDRLQLTDDQINEQDLAELKSSLLRVDDALAHPESFGVVRRGNRLLGHRKSDAELTDVTIMPLLLDAKTLIQDRLDDLRPVTMPSVGIDSVVKGLGLAAVVYAGNALFVVTVALARRRRKGKPALPPYRKTKLVLFAAAVVVGVIWLTGDMSPSDVGFGTSLILAGLLGMAIVLSKRYVPSRLEAGSVVVCVLLGFAAGLAVYAHDLGKAVRAGVAIEPVSIFGAPLLDVRARPVRVQWAGPAAQKPGTVFGDGTEICAIDLGRSATTQFLIIGADSEESGSGPALLEMPVAMLSIAEQAFDQCGDD